MAESWLTKQEEVEIFSDSGEGEEAGRLLELSDTNRLVADREQGVLLQVVDLIAARTRKLYGGNNTYGFIAEISERLQKVQLTTNGYSRTQFIQVATARAIAAASKKLELDLK